MCIECENPGCGLILHTGHPGIMVLTHIEWYIEANMLRVAPDRPQA